MSSTQRERALPGNNGTQKNDGKSTPETIPDLSEPEHETVYAHTALSAVVVHEAVREEGVRELNRSTLALAWSGLAAGLSMGFSLIAKALFDAYLPDAPWRSLLDNFGYSVGFLIVVLGRQQLFTENTLTVILPLLSHRTMHTFLCVVRLWAVVLATNLLGTLLFATLVAHVAIFSPEIQLSFLHVSQQSVSGAFGPTLVKGIFAGWLIALMVWLLPAAESTRLQVIIILTYLVGLGQFAHIIAGSVDAFYLVNLGKLTWLACIGSFIIPTLIGNIIGGVTLVAVLNYAQVASETVEDE
ncbi:MAG: formate/nitrite transporter family protein [Chloroflexi bacterium]|nr:MAG: formate/nitrite transporter family protein [Chloroflexota bacterium]